MIETLKGNHTNKGTKFTKAGLPKPYTLLNFRSPLNQSDGRKFHVLLSGKFLEPHFGNSVSSQGQESVDMFDKQHKGPGRAQKPQIKWKPDTDDLRVEDFPVGMQGSNKTEG